MKTIGGATLIGVLIALLVIYWLGPLNSGGVALVVLLCVSMANIIGGIGGAIAAFRKRAQEPGKPPRKKRGHHPKLLILALLLVGCALVHRPSTSSSSLPPSPAPEPPPPLPPRHPTTALPGTCQPPCSIPIPARGVLLRDQNPPAGYGAYGYVLFTARPDASSLLRYMALCQEYNDSLQPTSEFSDVSPDHLMVTFWLLSATPSGSSCDALVTSYDYARATVIVRSLGKLSSRGPILAAWRKPFKFGAASADEALVVDMSDFTNEGDISEAFRIWRDRISQDPDSWNHGFSLSLVRVALRSFLNTYGQQVVALIGGGGSH